MYIFIETLYVYKTESTASNCLCWNIIKYTDIPKSFLWRNNLIFLFTKTNTETNKS